MGGKDERGAVRCEIFGGGWHPSDRKAPCADPTGSTRTFERDDARLRRGDEVIEFTELHRSGELRHRHVHPATRALCGWRSRRPEDGAKFFAHRLQKFKVLCQSYKYAPTTSKCPTTPVPRHPPAWTDPRASAAAPHPASPPRRTSPDRAAPGTSPSLAPRRRTIPRLRLHPMMPMMTPSLRTWTRASRRPSRQPPRCASRQARAA